ncbi:hypothetical protein STEG23_029077 [Scotinomys teguina]
MRFLMRSDVEMAVIKCGPSDELYHSPTATGGPPKSVLIRKEGQERSGKRIKNQQKHRGCIRERQVKFTSHEQKRLSNRTALGESSLPACDSLPAPSAGSDVNSISSGLSMSSTLWFQFLSQRHMACEVRKMRIPLR